MARDPAHTTTWERGKTQFKQVPRLGFSLFKIPDSHYCRKWGATIIHWDRTKNKLALVVIAKRVAYIPNTLYWIGIPLPIHFINSTSYT
jgi:hypothetical protein